jgi:hypothetical protein
VISHSRVTSDQRVLFGPVVAEISAARADGRPVCPASGTYQGSYLQRASTPAPRPPCSAVWRAAAHAGAGRVFTVPVNRCFPAAQIADLIVVLPDTVAADIADMTCGSQ